MIRRPTPPASRGCRPVKKLFIPRCFLRCSLTANLKETGSKDLIVERRIEKWYNIARY
jgi:hypothetical protein